MFHGLPGNVPAFNPILREDSPSIQNDLCENSVVVSFQTYKMVPFQKDASTNDSVKDSTFFLFKRLIFHPMSHCLPHQTATVVRGYVNVRIANRPFSRSIIPLLDIILRISIKFLNEKEQPFCMQISHSPCSQRYVLLS